MKLQAHATKIVFALAFIALIIGFSAFSQKDKSGKYSFRNENNPSDSDTTTRSKHDRLLTDKEMDRLDAAMKRLDEQMEKLDEKMKHMDFSKTQRDVDDAMKKIDFQKINQQINAAMKQIDMAKIQAESKESFARLERVNKERVREQLERVRGQLEREKRNMNFNNGERRLNMEKTMQRARESMEKAKIEIQNLRDFTDELQKDGLIDKKKAYKVEVKDGELYINDNKQTKEVSDKYRKYYKKDNFTINMNADEGIRI
jgi:chromosome segregation ATPase